MYTAKCYHNGLYKQNIVWLEILADRWHFNIWQNLLWRLSKSAIMIFIAKWLIKCTGNLMLPCCLWPDTRSNHSNAETGNILSSSVNGRQRHQHQTLQETRAHHLDCLSCIDKPPLLPPLVFKSLCRCDVLIRSCRWWTPCQRLWKKWDWQCNPESV